MAPSDGVMSEFEVSDEFVAAVWDGLARELHELAAPCGIGERLADATFHYFCGMLANFPERVLASVGDTTAGTPHAFRVGISDKFHGHLAATAEDFIRRFGH